MSSSSLSDSSCTENLHAVGRRMAQEVRVGYRRDLDQVDRPPQEFLEAELQIHVPLERTRRRPIVELDKEVVITALWVELVTRRRAEQLQPADAASLAQVT